MSTALSKFPDRSEAPHSSSFPTTNYDTLQIGNVDVRIKRHFQDRHLALCIANLPSAATAQSTSQLFTARSIFGIVLHGSISTIWPKETICKATAGDWFSFRCGNEGLHVTYSETSLILWIQCSESSWQSFCPEDSLDLPYAIRGRCSEKMIKSATHLANQEGKTVHEYLMLYSQTIELFATILDHSNLIPNNGNDATDDPLLHASRILERNLDTDHTIRELSRQVQLNEFKLKRGFRERFNTTVFGFLRQKRMEKAILLFRSGETCVHRVAKSVGYSNPSHFAKAFRGVYGVNPKQFQAQISSELSPIYVQQKARPHQEGPAKRNIERRKGFRKT